MKKDLNKQLRALLVSYGYTISGTKNKVRIGRRGIMDASFSWRPYTYTSLFDVCDELIPILGNDFQEEFMRICKA